MKERLTKEAYYLGIAKAVCMRSTCLRRSYGAVIVKDDEIIATGYNGSPRGEVNCSDTGICTRINNNVPHGTCYSSDCPSVHAEMNAIISSSRATMQGGTLYLYCYDHMEKERLIETKPCHICAGLIKSSGLEVVN